MGRPLRVDGPRGARWDDCVVARRARTAEAAALERSTDSVNGSLALRAPLLARPRAVAHVVARFCVCSVVIVSDWFTGRVPVKGTFACVCSLSGSFLFWFNAFLDSWSFVLFIT